MKTLVTSQLMISKTKKRLSSLSFVYITFFTLMFLLTLLGVHFAFFLSNQNETNLVEGTIPIIENTAVSRQLPESISDLQSISKKTPVVILSRDSFIHGNLSAFSAGYLLSKNKYIIEHKDNQPQFALLVEELTLRYKNAEKISHLVFVPTGEIPMPIVVQIMEGLRKHSQFKKIILATGVI